MLEVTWHFIFVTILLCGIYTWIELSVLAQMINKILPRLVSHESLYSPTWSRLPFAEIWRKEGPESPHGFYQLPTLYLRICRYISLLWWLWTICSESAFLRFEDWTSIYFQESKQWKAMEGHSRNQNWRYGGTRISPRILSSRSYTLGWSHDPLAQTISILLF